MQSYYTELEGRLSRSAHAATKQAFHGTARRLMGQIAKDLGLEKGTYDIRTNTGGPAVLGETILHTEGLYVMAGDVTQMNDNLLYRSCNGRKDFSGGQNQYVSLGKLRWQASNVVDLFKAAHEKGIAGPSNKAVVSATRRMSEQIGEATKEQEQKREPKIKSNQIPAELVKRYILPAIQNEKTVPWRRPYSGVPNPMSYAMNKPYRGINRMMLPFVAGLRGYESPYWLTKGQINKEGGKLKEGSEGMIVVFWKWWNPNTKEIHDTPQAAKEQADGLVIKGEGEEPEEQDGLVTQEEQDELIPVKRYSIVYNGDCVEGIKRLDKLNAEAKANMPNKDFSDLEQCERILAFDHNPEIIHSAVPRACYNHTTDKIQLPSKGFFESEESYYLTAFHEIGHGTGHASRLDRKFTPENFQFGSKPYAQEELTAEMCAWFLGNETGIMPEVDFQEVDFASDHQLKNKVAYLQNWAERLEKDPNIIIVAAQRAEKAYQWALHGKKMGIEQEQPQQNPAEAIPVVEPRKALKV